MSSEFRWSLAWYAREGEELVGEIDLDAMTSARMRTIFSGAPDDPMVAVHPVSPKIAEELRRDLPSSLELDFARFDYFVECTRR